MLPNSQSNLKSICGSPWQGKDGLSQLLVSNKLQGFFRITSHCIVPWEAKTPFRKANPHLPPAQLVPETGFRGWPWARPTAQSCSEWWWRYSPLFREGMHPSEPDDAATASSCSQACAGPSLLSALALTHGRDVPVGLQTCPSLWTGLVICTLGGLCLLSPELSPELFCSSWWGPVGLIPGLCGHRPCQPCCGSCFALPLQDSLPLMCPRRYCCVRNTSIFTPKSYISITVAYYCDHRRNIKNQPNNFRNTAKKKVVKINNMKRSIKKEQRLQKKNHHNNPNKIKLTFVLNLPISLTIFFTSPCKFSWDSPPLASYTLSSFVALLSSLFNLHSKLVMKTMKQRNKTGLFHILSCKQHRHSLLYL